MCRTAHDWCRSAACGTPPDRRSIFSPNDIQRLVQSAPAGTNLTQLMYRQMLTGNKAFRSCFRALEAGETPILFHCTSGKDRTGVAAMPILLALGVPDETHLRGLWRRAPTSAAPRAADHAEKAACGGDRRRPGAADALADFRRGVDPETAPFVLRTIRQTTAAPRAIWKPNTA